MVLHRIVTPLRETVDDAVNRLWTRGSNLVRLPDRPVELHGRRPGFVIDGQIEVYGCGAEDDGDLRHTHIPDQIQDRVIHERSGEKADGAARDGAAIDCYARFGVVPGYGEVVETPLQIHIHSAPDRQIDDILRIRSCQTKISRCHQDIVGRQDRGVDADKKSGELAQIERTQGGELVEADDEFLSRIGIHIAIGEIPAAANDGPGRFAYFILGAVVVIIIGIGGVQRSFVTEFIIAHRELIDSVIHDRCIQRRETAAKMLTDEIHPRRKQGVIFGAGMVGGGYDGDGMMIRIVVFYDQTVIVVVIRGQG